MFLSYPVMHPGFSCCVLDPPFQEISIFFLCLQALEHHHVYSVRLKVQEDLPALCSASILQLAIHVFSESSDKIGDWAHSHGTPFMTATWGYKVFIENLASFSFTYVYSEFAPPPVAMDLGFFSPKEGYFFLVLWSNCVSFYLQLSSGKKIHNFIICLPCSLC